MNVPSLPTPLEPALPHGDWLTNVQQTLSWLVRATGFWLAVVLPFLYLPLLLRGFGGRGELLAFAGLVVLNAVALVVGHEYRR